jgi:hypothetical protein
MSPPAIPLFNSTKKKNEISLTHSHTQNPQTIQYTGPTPFSFINPLIYQQYSHLFNQFMPQVNPHLPQPYNSENFHYCPDIQSQGFINSNVNTNTDLNMNANANVNTSTGLNANTNTNANVNTNVNTNTNVEHNMNINSITIDQFLENLDKEYGTGIFTKYTSSFKEQEVDVLDIVNLKESDWVMLGIEKIGPRSKIIRALEKYK